MERLVDRRELISLFGCRTRPLADNCSVEESQDSYDRIFHLFDRWALAKTHSDILSSSCSCLEEELSFGEGSSMSRDVQISLETYVQGQFNSRLLLSSSSSSSARSLALSSLYSSHAKGEVARANKCYELYLALRRGCSVDDITKEMAPLLEVHPNVVGNGESNSARIKAEKSVQKDLVLSPIRTPYEAILHFLVLGYPQSDGDGERGGGERSLFSHGQCRPLAR